MLTKITISDIRVISNQRSTPEGAKVNVREKSQMLF